eukprot:2402356-Amphidinium_carterae.1
MLLATISGCESATRHQLKRLHFGVCLGPLMIGLLFSDMGRLYCGMSSFSLCGTPSEPLDARELQEPQEELRHCHAALREST